MPTIRERERVHFIVCNFPNVPGHTLPSKTCAGDSRCAVTGTRGRAAVGSTRFRSVLKAQARGTLTTLECKRRPLAPVDLLSTFPRGRLDVSLSPRAWRGERDGRTCWRKCIDGQRQGRGNDRVCKEPNYSTVLFLYTFSTRPSSMTIIHSSLPFPPFTCCAAWD